MRPREPYFRLPSGPNSDVQGPKMIQQSMAYHRALADTVQQASTFLGDLADIKAIADAAAPDAKLIVMHAVDGHATRANVPAEEIVNRGRNAADTGNLTGLRVVSNPQAIADSDLSAGRIM